MSTLQQLVNQIAIEVNDPTFNSYQPAELAVYCNYAIRQFRRSIMELRPRLLREPPLKGQLTSDTITFGKQIYRIIEVRLGGKRIYEVISEDHRDSGDYFYDYDFGRGNEHGYIVEEFNSIKVVPLPHYPHNYEIEWVAGTDQNLGLNDDSGLPAEIEDLIIEGAVVRAGVKNGATMDEAAFVKEVRAQIEENIMNLGGPRRVVVKGFRSNIGWRRRYRR